MILLVSGKWNFDITLNGAAWQEKFITYDNNLSFEDDTTSAKNIHAQLHMQINNNNK